MVLAYKLVVSVLFGSSAIVQILKTAQASHYAQPRLVVINASALAIAVTMLVWTWRQ